MSDRPNVLVLMMDQCRADVLDAAHPCQTPHLDRLRERGVQVTRAYTTNPVCSPARASLMTGLLPSRHHIRWVTHCVDGDLAQLDTSRPQWAQVLRDAGYRTGYFGKWHVDAGENYDRGWQTMIQQGDETFRDRVRTSEPVWQHRLEQEGYGNALLYGVVRDEGRSPGVQVACDLGIEWLQQQSGQDPWCCMISVLEPHDPFVCGESAYARYDVDGLPLSPSHDDDLAGRPGLYRRCQRIFEHLDERQQRELRACYWANVSEVDEQFGRVLSNLEAMDQLDNTIVVVTSDHGDHLGDHGISTKNVHAGEGVYLIPLLMAGPGITASGAQPARVGIHEIGSTLLELCDCAALPDTDGASFTPLLRGDQSADHYANGYAEYEGSRWNFTQRIIWRGTWKLVVNGFDEDEFYDLAADPHEVDNRIDDPALEAERRACYQQFWQRAKAAGDHTLVRTNYPPLRLLPYGPGIAE